MKLAAFTVDRPVFTSMMALIAVVVGVFALSRLPIDLMPEITPPTLSIVTSYPGAAPEEIEESITRRIEQAVATVSGIEEISSTSSEGNSNVRVSFRWGTNLDEAANDLRDRLDGLGNSLPAEANRPSLRKFDVSQLPIMIVGISSPMDPIALRTLIDEQIAHRLERVPGVAAVDIWGGLAREIQVRVHPERLQSMNLSLDNIRQALREANVTLPAGQVERGRLDVAVRTPGQFTDLSEIENLVVARRNGTTIRLGQIAEVADTHGRIQRIQRINGEGGVRLAVQKQSGTNTVEVAEQVALEIQRIARDFPQLGVIPVMDQSGYIVQSIDNLTRTLLYGGLLAVLVLLFFLRNVRGTLAVATAIPISVVAAFALIFFGDFTLNLMTLGGLALGVGLMVDNAIVVLENISRMREEENKPPREAAILGTGQVGAAIIASTASTLIIFAPLVFAQGMAAEMFKQLAYTVAFALTCSLVVALTVVPMLAAHLLRDETEEEKSGVGHPFKRVAHALGDQFRRLESAYQNVLGVLLRHRMETIGVALLSLLLGLALMPRIGSELMPQADENEVRVSVEMEPGTRLEVLDRVMHRVEAIVNEHVPERRASETSLGVGWQGGSVTGNMTVSLVGARERSRSSQQVARELDPLLQEIPGATIRTRAGQGLFVFRRLGVGGGGGGEALEVELRGFDLDRLEAIAHEIQAGMDRIPGITDTRVNRERGIPQELIVLDRARAADLNVSMERAASTLQAAIAGVRAGDFVDNGREYEIRLQLQDAERLSQAQILNLTVPNGESATALRNIVRLSEGLGPQQIERKDQQRIGVVFGNISGRDLGSVAADVREMLRGVPMPEGYEAFVGGEFEQQQEAFSELGLAMLLAVLLVYMVLASLYESLRNPLVVMCTVPLSIIGVNLMLFATGTTYNLQSMIGMIMLVGIVVNNSILIVDQTARLQSEGLRVADAVLEAGRRRLRPVLMTSLTTTFALLPLALGIGEGAEAQAPMARAVIGGLLSAMLVTLLVIPVIYTFVNRDPEPFAQESPLQGALRPA